MNTYIHGLYSRQHLFPFCDSKHRSLRGVGDIPTMHNGDGEVDDGDDGDRDVADDDYGAPNHVL